MVGAGLLGHRAEMVEKDERADRLLLRGGQQAAHHKAATQVFVVAGQF
jgi:hypothetical protein